MKAYSQDLRDRVIDLYKTGDRSSKAISTLLKISYQTIRNWIKRYETTGDYSSRQHKVAGRQARFEDKSAILAYLEEHPDADGIQIRDEVAPYLPMSTFYDTLHRMNITYKKKSQDINSDQKAQELNTSRSWRA